MLLIISDLHLTDGSSGTTIGPHAFKIFKNRLQDLAYEASWRKGGKYRPVGKVDIILLGDILDVIRSNKWLDDGVTIRPWSNVQSEELVSLVENINDAILEHNTPGLNILKNLKNDKQGAITIPGADTNDKPLQVGYESTAEGRVEVKVNIHYMVGNHDWFYHLPGHRYSAMRKKVVEAIGLVNDPEKPFPHNSNESVEIQHILDEHHVLARHGDIYDPFNYEDNRDASSLGDAIVVELLNRFPMEVAKRFADRLPPAFTEGLKEIDNVRPLLIIPLWISGLLERTCSNDKQLSEDVKNLWNQLADDFLSLDFVKSRDSFWNPIDAVDKLQIALKITNKMSFRALSNIISWFQRKGKSRGESYVEHALKEKEINADTRFIIYGHTHYPELVPLEVKKNSNCIYLNSGTWRAVHELTRAKRKAKNFVGFKVMSYVTIFKEDERSGRTFEFWNGSLGE